MTEKENQKPSEENSGVLTNSRDVNELLQTVLREAYEGANEDLRAFAEKVRELNKRKKAIRDYLTGLRTFKAEALTTARERDVDLGRANKEDMAALKEAFEKHARAHTVGDVEFELCIPDRVPSARVTNFELLESEIARWSEKLNSIGDDAQLANVDLQNILQKQQQTLQMMSNISKMLFDTAMSVIRKIGG